jgi:hypothetical protein
MFLTRQFIFTTTFDAGDMYTLNAALSHYQTHCRMQLAQGEKSPFWVHDKDIDRIRVRHRGSVLADKRGRTPVAQAPKRPLQQFTFTALFYESEMITLDVALSHYQELCQHELAPGTPTWAHDVDIENIRQKLSYVAAPDDPPDEDLP